MGGTIIREAESEDARAIAEVGRASWEGTYRGLLPDAVIDAQSVERRAEGWLARLSEGDPERRTWVAQVETRLIGYSSSGPPRDAPCPAIEDGRACEIYSLYVEPDSWGGGHGRALLSHALADLFDRGFDVVLLWVLASNVRARRFYERNRFLLESDGVPRGFDGHEFPHALYARRADDRSEGPDEPAPRQGAKGPAAASTVESRAPDRMSSWAASMSSLR